MHPRFDSQDTRGSSITLFSIVVRIGLLLLVTVPIQARADEAATDSHDLEFLWRTAQDGLKQVDDFVTETTALPDSIEGAIGENIAKRLNSEFRLIEDWRTRQVRNVGKRLVPYVKRQGIQYRFNLIHSDTINAYSIAGGHIWVTTSMFDLIGEDEAELAGILGHEIAHVDSRHCIRGIQYQIFVAGIDPEYAEYVRIGYGAYRRGYSQLNELESDRIGAEIVHAAGISPWGLVQVMSKFTAMEPSHRNYGDPESVTDAIALAQNFLKTHPASAERKEKLIEFIQSNLDSNTGR
jgi:predicted Zn-dependent protease